METCYSNVIRRWVLTLLDFCFYYEGAFYNYPTLIFYQMSYELAVIWQASRRHYRLNQKVDCRTYYLAYENTLQAAAVEIMAEKQVAASAIQGKFSAEGLSAMAQGVDPRLKLAEKLSKSDNSDRKTLENMFDALNNSNKSVDIDERYDDSEKALTYYEIMGESAVSDVVTASDMLVFDFNVDENTCVEAMCIGDSDSDDSIIEVEQTTTDDMSIFDVMFGFTDMVETLNISAAVTDNSAERKPKKKSVPTYEGQVSLFELVG